MFTKFWTKSGFSILEVLVSLGILGTVSYVGMTGLESIDKYKVETKKNVSMDNTVSSIVQSIRSNINFQKINFDPDQFLKETDLTKINEILPMAWNDKIIVPKDECSQCLGRMGYVVSPLPGLYRGLWKVTLRLTHSELIPEGFKDLTFYVSGK